MNVPNSDSLLPPCELVSNMQHAMHACKQAKYC